MIQIKVFMNDSAFNENKAVYENVVKGSQEFIDNLSSVYATMRSIYGKFSIVTFNFLPL